MRRGARAAALLLLCSAPAAADRAAELEALRLAIEDHRERVERYESEERSLLETLEEMDRAVDALRSDAGRAGTEAAEARVRLVELEGQEEVLAERLVHTRRALSIRSVALYKAGEPGPLRVLFAAESLPDLLRRMEALRLLVERDRSLIQAAHAAARSLEEARAEARRVAEVGEAAAARLVRRSSQLEREQRARRKLLVRARRDRTRVRAALYELEAAAKTLEETLERLGARAPSGAAAHRFRIPFASRRGALASPVAGAVAAPFGKVVDREFSTETFRSGVEFEAAEGTPVRAVADGEVRFAGWFRGYGKLVILDHGADYFTVSGHLDELQVSLGDSVATGTPIGSVGQTGSLLGPRLYFELRKGRQPLDPGAWFRHQVVD
ncbi:MAG: peptidoglycan DD-metalloendopeptidase family protein [Myxococcota bacterium]